MRSRTTGFSLLIAACLTVVGCTASPATPKPQEPTSVSTAGASQPTEPPAAVLAFDGDCAAALSDDDAFALLGDGASLAPEDVQQPAVTDFGAERAAFDAAGGLECGWQAADGSMLEIAVLPLAVVSQQRIDAAAPTTCSPVSGIQRCSIELSVSDSWLMVSAPTPELVNGALAPIGSRLGDQHPQPTPVLVGAWNAVPCFAAGQFVQIATGAAGTPEPDADEGDPIRGVLWGDGRLVRCSYSGLGAGVASLAWEAVSGVSNEELAMDGLAAADVDGFEHAWTNADGSVLAVQTGEASADTAANMLVVRGQGAKAPEAMAKLAAALVASMPQRAVSTP